MRRSGAPDAPDQREDLIARRRQRRRPGAGPPPQANPRAGAERDSGRAPARRRAAPEIRPPSFPGVVLRAAIVCVLFLPYLLYIADEPLDRALFITGVAFVVMVPLGMAIDRMRYRLQMRKRATPPPAEEPEE